MSGAARWAVTPLDVARAQRLRFRIFAQEMGATLQGMPTGHDVDEFDAHCLHLLVVSQDPAGEDEGEVVATCRVLLPDGARQVGRLYSEGEFDLSAVRDLMPGTLEMGRVCVAPAWRNGLLILSLWRELGKLMQQEGLDVLIGCASVGVSDGGVCRAIVEPAARVPPGGGCAARAALAATDLATRCATQHRAGACTHQRLSALRWSAVGPTGARCELQHR